MASFLKILTVFILGFIASQLAQINFQSKTSPLKIAEITKEATTASSAVTESPETATVLRVIDGDTVELNDKRRVRYIGIDTPEVVDPNKPVECFGPEAKAANQSLVEGKSVRLVKDISEVDKYGRLLRYVYFGDTLVNDYLVRQGFAHASTYPPDVELSEQLRQAEKEARVNTRGLWSNCASL